MINHLLSLNDLVLIQMFSNMDESDRKSSSKVCKLFHNIITQSENGSNSIIFSRQKFLEDFLLNPVPGLNTSYHHVFEIFQNKGIEVYISGGLTRDLLGMRSSQVLDIDFSFTGPIEKIVEIAQENFWKFSKRPDFPVIQIGNLKDCCMEGISVDYTLKAPIESLEFCLNNVSYHCNKKQLIDRTGKGFDAILSRKLNLPIEDKEKWLSGEVFGSSNNKIFRVWKMIGRGFILDAPLHPFLYAKSKDSLKLNREQFLQDMVLYLGRDYGDYDSYKKGCALLMGAKWKDKVIVPMENEIVSSFKNKEMLRNKYTYF